MCLVLSGPFARNLAQPSVRLLPPSGKASGPNGGPELQPSSLCPYKFVTPAAFALADGGRGLALLLFRDAPLRRRRFRGLAALAGNIGAARRHVRKGARGARRLGRH